MESVRKVIIKNGDLEKLKVKGEGRDAIVYKAGKGLLYKVYKNEHFLDDRDSRTRSRSEYNNKKYNLKNTYIDKEGVRIYYKDAINKIAKRQKDIKYSNLPYAPLYMNNKFVGCVLKEIHAIQLHYIWIFLSKKRRIKILREILKKVKELTDHNIYPLDTANSPFVGNHSNILLNYKLQPELIDLDGCSTIYRETPSQEYLKSTFFSLNLLFLELLFGFELSEELESIEFDTYKRQLIQLGYSEEFATKLMNYEANYDELEELLQSLTLKK